MVFVERFDLLVSDLFESASFSDFSAVILISDDAAQSWVVFSVLDLGAYEIRNARDEFTLGFSATAFTRLRALYVFNRFDDIKLMPTLRATVLVDQGFPDL